VQFAVCKSKPKSNPIAAFRLHIDFGYLFNFKFGFGCVARNSNVCVFFWYYWTLLDSNGSYWTLLDCIGSYLTLLDLIGPYWALLDFYWALLGPIGPYWALLDPIGLYWILLDLLDVIGLYWTLWDPTGELRERWCGKVRDKLILFFFQWCDGLFFFPLPLVWQVREFFFN